MTTRNVVLFGIGMLVLGLLLGLVTGGVAGFFMGGQSARAALSRNINPFQVQPIQPNLPGELPRDRSAVPPNSTVASGARIIIVEKGSPAAVAGLLAGDIITGIDNTKLDDTHSLGDLMQTRKPGDKIALTVVRGKQNLTVNVELGKAPQDSNIGYLGIRFAPTYGGTRRY